jgi:hypothetical protein
MSTTSIAVLTGKERDNETGLDYFGARYFSGAQGRFTSPDPFSAVDELSARLLTTISEIRSTGMSFFTDLFFRAGDIINPPPVQARPKEQVTSKICYTDENGEKVCQ